MKKIDRHVVTGMSRDMVVQRFEPNLVADARNIRITARDGNSTLLSVTNEKGTSEFSITGDPIVNNIIGYNVLDDILILFTTGGNSSPHDRIYKVEYDGIHEEGNASLIFSGDLNFNASFPIETLGIIESSTVKKVYWVDGLNQPRMLNIYRNYNNNDNDVFDFCPAINLSHTLEVIKNTTGGEFPVGTIQYCFSYFNLNGQETNLVEASPLYYLSPIDRGLPADSRSTNSFTINLTNLDTSFDYVRLYSIIRTSENATPSCKIIGDFKISSVISIENPEDQENNVTIETSSCYIVDTATGSRVLLSSLYPNSVYNDQEIELSLTKYILDSLTNKVYYLKDVRDDSKRSYIKVSRYASPWIISTNNQGAYNRLTVADFITDARVVTVVDNGTIGSTLDPTALYFIGGKTLCAGTLAQKDNTLFLGEIKKEIPTVGNIEINGTAISSLSLKESLITTGQSDTGSINCKVFEYSSDDKPVSQGKFYDEIIDNRVPSITKKGFKFGENYRIGFIAQYITGEWSDAIWIGDVTETRSPSVHSFKMEGGVITEWESVFRKPGFEVTFPQSLKNALINNKFIAVAPVVVFPKDAERAVLYQGILSGTVFNVRDRANNSPFVQADWRFRFGYNWNSIDNEIQCNECWDSSHMNPPFPYKQLSPGEYMSKSNFIDNYGNYYYRDPNILTFHSPDVEVSDSIMDADLENTYLYIVGFSNSGFGQEVGNDLGTSIYPQQIAYSYTDSDDTGINDNLVSEDGASTESPHIARIFNINYGYLDYLKNHNVPTPWINSPNAPERYKITRENLCFPGYINVGIRLQILNDWYLGYAGATYIWNRASSDTYLKTSANGTTMLIPDVSYNKKCISELRYGTTTYFSLSQNPVPYRLDIFEPKIFDSDEIIPKKIKCATFDENNGEVFYYGNIDKVLFGTYPITFFEQEDGAFQDTADLKSDLSALEQYCEDWNSNTTPQLLDTDMSINGGTAFKIYVSNPVRIKYKSTKHIVFGLQDSTLIDSERWNDLTHFYWQDSEINLYKNGLNDTMLLDEEQDPQVPVFNTISNSVIIGELRRDISSMTRFGGRSLEAFANNVWIKCGEVVPLVSGDSHVTLEYEEGDTYIGRYDCLKTYPFTQEDQNSIVSIYSTELESRVNLDLRYDKNRGLQDNTLITPQNFNLFNRPGYDQTNQYFTYQALNPDRYTTQNFFNMITWSLEKSLGEDIDTWTSIPLTSNFFLDGDRGNVTKLVSWKDNLFAFQRKGFSQLLYNSRVQIPVSDGQPIEITNSAKMAGKRYLSEDAGCLNKWSVCSTDSGIYFVDDINESINVFNGNLISLSSTKGFDTWIQENYATTPWIASWEGDGIRTFYDSTNKDLYFMSKNESLVFSEKIGTFISFMDYGSLPFMANLNNKFLTGKINSETKVDTLYELWGGDYNYFFGEFRPYWLTFVSNIDPTQDKVFDTLEWRNINYTNTDGVYGAILPEDTFDCVRVWHDYQDTDNVPLIFTKAAPSNLKKKFNTFRFQIPRDKRQELTSSTRDRIRNNWTYVQLSKYTSNRNLMIFNDLDVTVFE